MATEKHYPGVLAERIIVSAEKGSSEPDALRGAMLLALTEMRSVELTWNGKVYVINIHELITTYAKKV